MKTYNRICIADHTITALDGNTHTIKRGEEYLTSDVDKSGKEVTVFTTYWVNHPVINFAGEIPFTS